MGQQQSKGELLYEQVSLGNDEGLRALHRDDADLEWKDKKGKTPLILASMNSKLHDVGKTLIELGSNVNAYRPGRHAGTPMHHAARKGLEKTVKLLLSHGANPLVLNDDSQTPLEVARVKGFSNVVRAIESHICLFSGWMREFYGPTFLDLFAPKLLLRKVWVVIVPTCSRTPTKPFKLELVVYATLQDAKPRTVMPLWRAILKELKPNRSDTSVMILDYSTKTRLKLAPSIEGDGEQLKLFCDACKGNPQPMHNPTQKISITNQILITHQNITFTGNEETSSGFDSHENVILQEALPSAPPLLYDDVDIETIEGDIRYGQCAICLDGPSDAVCVPCGHVAGCLSCLTEIKSKKWGCPVCRAEIDQIIKMYRV